MTGWTIATVLAAAKAAGPKVALRCEDRRVTFDQLLSRSERLASGLAAAGARPGDRIALLCRNSVESVELFLAAARLGAILVPMEIGLRRLEVDHLLRETGTRWLFADWSGWDVAGGPEELGEGLMPVAIGCELRAASGEPITAYEELLSAGQEPWTDFDAAPEQPLLLRFARGGSGLPRAWAHSHSDVLASALRQLREFELGRDDVYVSAPGTCWALDPRDLSLAAWLAGATVELAPARRFHPVAHCAALAAAEASATVISPSQLRMMLASDALSGAALDRLRVLCVGTSVRNRLLEDVAEELPGCLLAQVYAHPGFPGGLASIGPEEAAERPGSSGRATPGCELAVLDGNGEPLPPGCVGEVACRSLAGLGADGDGDWLGTGDRGYLDSEGYLFVTERGAETILSAGLDVSLAEVEAILGEHDAVAEIALVPVPDDALGEASLAHVVTRPGRHLAPALLTEYAQSRLAPHKVPLDWVLHEEPLPRASCGRLEKRSLAVAGLGSQVV